MLGNVVRLLLLAAAWMLMRRYVFRRRTRINRELFVAKVTEKLRALTKLRVRRTELASGTQRLLSPTQKRVSC
jgi:hypothetical protein